MALLPLTYPKAAPITAHQLDGIDVLKPRFAIVLVLFCAVSAKGNDVPRIDVRLNDRVDNRVDFEVWGDHHLNARYPDVEQMPVPVHEKYREAFRRLAAEELSARGLCPGGFTGPQVVVAESAARQHWHFSVTCK